ncbi:MAG: Uma2 family endonuclease [Candidatus Latescibacterota bacterium]
MLTGEVGVYTRRNPDRVRGVDVAFISRQRLPGGPGSGFLAAAPELVVEILSPADRWEDVYQKLEEYFELGVERVWVVEPGDRTVAVYRSTMQSQRFGQGDQVRGEGALEGFALDVTELFG